MRKLDRLCHLADADNVPSILERGLLTERLLGPTGMAKTERAAAPRRQRRESLRRAECVTIPEQRPMPPSDLACALDDGSELGDFYVSLGPNRKRMDRQRHACSYRPQVALIEHFGTHPFLCPSIAETHDASWRVAAATHWCLRDVASRRMADTAVLARGDLVWMRVAR